MAKEDKPVVMPVVDLAELFAMPLTALIEADAYAAQTFIEFIRRYGFEGGNKRDFDDFGKLKMVSFTYTKVGAGGRVQTANIDIPLILLIPLPALAIEDASMKFDVEIFGIVERSEEAQQALTSDLIPREQRPVSRRAKQMKVRIARSSRRGAVTGGDVNRTERAEAKSSTSMQVDVRLRQSDLPEGILQLLNLTAQSSGERESTVPYITLEAEGGRVSFRQVGEKVTIGARLMGMEEGRDLRVLVTLEQGPEDDLFQLPTHLRTDRDGRATFTARLAELPEPPAAKILQTITARAEVETDAYGLVMAEGFLRLPVTSEE